LTVSFAAALEQATKEAVCGWLANGGNASVASWIVKGSKTPVTAVAGAAAGLGLLAVNYACNYDPANGAQDPDAPTGCYEAAAGGWINANQYRTNFGNIGVYVPFIRKVLSFTQTGTGSDGWGPNKTYQLDYIDKDGNSKTANFVISAVDWMQFDLAEGTCSSTGGPTGELAPYTYVDQTTNCTYVVAHEAWVMGDDGVVTPVLKIEPGQQSRASGGVIGGCNFGPVLYMPGGGGGDIVGGPPGGGGGIFPWTPGPDGPNGEPWWWDVVKGALGSVLGAAINRLVDKLLEEKAPEVVYRLVSVCEKDAQGEAISDSREVSIPSLPVLDGLVARVDALDDLMQGLKDFKQPICEPEPPAAPVGRNISIQFRSDGVSPFGEKPLRKVFRYRDPSLKDLEAHYNHWKDFEWESGPWMVISQGLEWGKPQAWAKSEEEGKRVLSHAAQIAGMNLNSSSHRWRVAEVVGYRERPVMKMRVHRDVNGRLWIAERTGPAGPPMVLGQPSPVPKVDH
jgi:hypothetical protein